MKKVVSIDMGAKNNGVYIVDIKNDEIVSKNAVNYIFKDGDINFLKKDRTSKRHQRRAFKRAKFARRLLDELLNKIKTKDLSQNELELIYGLLKNRGFNYINIEFENDLSDESLEVLNEIDCYEFKGCVNKDDYELRLSKFANDYDEGEFCEFLAQQNELILQKVESGQNVEFKKLLEMDEIYEILKKYPKHLDFSKCDSFNKLKKTISDYAKDSEFLEFLKANDEVFRTEPIMTYKLGLKSSDRTAISDMFEALRNEMLKNNKHREKYLKDIKELCKSVEFKSIISKLNISDDEFANLIGNISNYQTRVLRKYFNNKFDDAFDDEKLKKVSIKNINFLSFKGEKELENKRTMLKNLKKSSFEYLCKNDPITSIPPYERMNNKHPQTCYSLVLKDGLSDRLKTCLKHILDNPNFSSLTMDENGVIKQYDELDENELKVVFQRFLDISKGYLEDIKLYPRSFDEHGWYFKEQICLNDSDFNALKDFASRYYDELLLAKKGILKAKILKPCGCHTPYKNNSKHIHLSILLGKKDAFSKEEVKNISDFINDKNSKYKGNSTLKGFLTHLSETAKGYQNSFYELLESNVQDDKDLKKIKDDYMLVYKKLKSIKEFAFIKDEEEQNTIINYLLQTANIIFDEQKGFHKLCQTHATENLLRISGDKAMCSALGSDSARLINGRVEMYIDRLAYEIVSDLDLSDTEELSINIEQNAFTFETAAKELTKTKVKRKPKERFAICPYSGEPVNLKNAEYDHILPRSKCKYNSQANLIPVKSYENFRKSDGCMYFNDLHENYKKDIFRKCEVKNENELKSFIDKTLNAIDIKKYTNFKNLKIKEQIAFQMALFMPNESFYKIALKLLAKDKQKTSTNGTQKRLARLMVQNALAKNNTLNIKVNFVDSKLTSAIRKELSEELPQIAKEEKQSSHSHCIDASVVFYIASAIKDKKVVAINENVKFEPKFKFSDIYLKESEIKNIQSQKYLELSQDKISRKQLFKDTIYSLRYENAKALSDKQFGALKELDLLMEVKKLKSARFHINTKKVFDLIFASFEAKDIKTLEKIKFLDKFLVSSVRKDILSIFFDDKKGELIKPKDSGANIEKFYEILVKNGVKDKSEVEKIQKLYIDNFYTGNQKDIKKARNKRRVTYSLSVVSGASFVVRRNTGYEGLANENIATKNYLDKDKIVGIKYHTKNVLPLKITDILDILNLSENAKEIYKISIKNSLPEKISKLDFIVSEAARHTVFVYFDKAKLGYDLGIFKDTLSVKNDEWVKFCDECLNADLVEFLGKPRDYKASIICDNSKILGLKYTANQTSKANREIMKANIC